MSFASYCPPLAARDMGTTSEVEESKDYESSLFSWQHDPPLTARDVGTTSEVEQSKDYGSSMFDWQHDPSEVKESKDYGSSMFDWQHDPSEVKESKDYRSSLLTLDGFLWGNCNYSEGMTSPVPAPFPLLEQDPEPVASGSGRSPSSKEPSPSIEEAIKSSRLISKRRGRCTHISSVKRGKYPRVAQGRVRACASCQANGLGGANIRNAIRPFNAARQSGKRKLDQSSESKTTDYLDPRRPEIHAKPPDEISYKRAAGFGCPDRNLFSQVRDKSISPQANEERPPMNQGSEGPKHSNSDHYQGPLPPSLHGQLEHIEGQHKQGSSELSANAGDRGCLIPWTVSTKKEQVGYAEDLMQSIRSRVLSTWETQPSMKLILSLAVFCNVQGFMEKQFHGSNKNLGQVIVLSGTATHGQATTCSDYIRTNWPLRGPWLLDMLQVTFDGAGRNAEGRDNDLEVYDINITTTSIITVDFIGSKEATIDILQLLVWFGAAFQVSSSDQLQYSESKLQMFEDPMRGDGNFTVNYEKSPVSEQSCWFSLFNNPVIAHGFHVPKRRNSERGLELPIELMATLGGGRHAIDFEGGLVIKGHSIAFVPVEQYEDTIQWHMISNSDGTRLRYSDLRIPRALQKDVDFESIRTKRAILGWSQVAQTLLGTASFNYEDIDWSEAKEAGRSARLSGAGLGFQSNLIGQLNFALGAKDGRLLMSHDGPLAKIIDIAEKTPIVLYDHGERRAWLVPALEVILHVIHTRSCLNLYKSDRSKTKISYLDETAKISDQAARRAVMASKDQQLYEGTSPGEKAYCVRDAALDIWSLLERMMERDAVITSAPGVPLRGTMRDKLYGWEFRALVEDKSSFRQKEQVLEKTNGGWVDLIDDTDTVVLFGNGFQEVIKPVPSCSTWRVLPKGKDYLAVGCPMLETLYNEAGSRKTRSYLTSRHLQWHRGSTLFERCDEMPGCACDRLQQLVYDSWTTFRRVNPPRELPQNGCVIFGQANHPIMPAKRTHTKPGTIYTIPNGPLLETKLTEPQSPTYLPTTSLGFRPVMPRMPEDNDLSSLSGWSSLSATDYESDSDDAKFPLKRRRKVDGQDAVGTERLNGKEIRHSVRRSLLQGTLKNHVSYLRNMKSKVENRDNNEVRSFPHPDKDRFGQGPRDPGGKVAFGDFLHWQNRQELDYDSEVEKGVEMRHASMAVNCSK